MEAELSPSLSEDDWEAEVAELSGTLNKWTNYIHGWQPRFMALKEGSLVYYKSASETDFGCRGAISVGKAAVTKHELDEMRFDVSVGDCVWYLRASTVEDRERWVSGLQASIAPPSLSRGHRRQGSALSVSSVTPSLNSGKLRHSQALTEKLAECETFRDILCGQVDTLQAYFDSCAESQIAAEMPPVGQQGVRPLDFKGEAITFKATTAGILATLGYCLELLAQREEQVGKRLEKEAALRRQAEERCKLLEAGEAAMYKEEQGGAGRKGPDFVEGPHSQMAEDEFYDAVESALDKLEVELEMKDEVKSLAELKVEVGKGHRLDAEIDGVSKEQLRYAKMAVTSGGAWELFADDGKRIIVQGAVRA